MWGVGFTLVSFSQEPHGRLGADISVWLSPGLSRVSFLLLRGETSLRRGSSSNWGGLRFSPGVSAQRGVSTQPASSLESVCLAWRMWLQRQAQLGLHCKPYMSRGESLQARAKQNHHAHPTVLKTPRARFATGINGCHSTEVKTVVKLLTSAPWCSCIAMAGVRTGM